MNDTLLMARLEAHHAKARFVSLLRYIDFFSTEKHDAGDRIYLAYVLAAIAICAALCWMALLDIVTAAATHSGAALLALLSQGAPLAVAITFAAFLHMRLRRSPLKISAADASLLSAGRFPLASFAAPRMAASLAICLVAGGFAGYAMGAGAHAVSPAYTAGSMAMVAGALFFCAEALGWAAGLSRYCLPPRGVRAARFLAIPITFILIGAGAVISYAFSSGAVGIPLALIGETGAPHAAMSVLGGNRSTLALAFDAALAAMGQLETLVIPLALIFLLVGGMGIAMFVLVSYFANLTLLIEESDDNAAAPSWEMALYAPDAHAELRQRFQTQNHLPTRSFSLGSDTPAFLKKALLSHARRWRGLTGIVAWSGIVAPLGALLPFMAAGVASSNATGIPFALLWLALSVSLIPQAKEFTSVYRRDRAQPLVTDRIPLKPISLLALDSLPAFSLAALISIFAVAGFIAPLGIEGGSLAVVFATALLINAAPIICALFDQQGPWQEKRGNNGALVLFGMLLATGLVSLFASPWLVASALGALAIAAIAKGSATTHG